MMRSRFRGTRWAAPVRIWSRLPSSDRVAVLETAVLLPLVAMGLRTLGVTRTHRLVRRRPLALRRSPDEARRLASLVESVARRGPMRYSCLERSFVLWRMMRGRGLAADLRLGVRTGSGGDHRFHAWVEHGDDVINDEPGIRGRYISFRSASAWGSVP